MSKMLSRCLLLLGITACATVGGARAILDFVTVFRLTLADLTTADR